MPNAQIASMLARSGANIGQAIGSPVAQFGKDIGGMLTARSQRKEQDAQDQQVQKELQQYANNPAQLNALCQKYQSMGKENVAKAFCEAAKQASAKDAAAAKVATATETKNEARGVQGGLMAITEAASRGVALSDLREAQSSVLAQGGTQKQIVDAYNAGKGGEGKVSSSRGADEWVDEDGNYYSLSILRTDRGESKQWIPVTPGAPKNPVGEVTPVGGAYKQTAQGDADRTVDTARRTTEAENFAKLRIEAVDSLPSIEETINSTQKSLAILEEIKTGGWSTELVREASSFLGVTPRSEAEFNLEAGKQVLAGLSAFEGAISEGEREYLKSLYQDLAKSKGANRGILNIMLDAANRALRDASTRATSNTFEEYLENREGYGSPLAKPKKRVSFSDLQRGS